VHFVANRPRNAAGQDVAGDHFPARTRVSAWRPRKGRVAPGFDADPLAVAGDPLITGGADRCPLFAGARGGSCRSVDRQGMTMCVCN
jgi:hypothetical protein